jgi:ChrR Cupin-like domain
MIRSLLLCVTGMVFMVSVISLHAQEKIHGGNHSSHIMLVPSDLKWKDGPASLPGGAKFAVIEGDPSKAGPFTMRFKLPANYIVPPHWHPAIEHITVISGTFYMGIGETFDESHAVKLPAGGFAVMAIGTRHFGFTKEGTVIQVHGVGPWGITYVNPKDDPRK